MAEILRDRYVVLEVLGRGAEEGRTLLATDLELDREVVIKEFRVAGAENWKAVELFERGGYVLRSLEHPQIPAFYDMFQEAGETRFYVVQERIEGRDLAAVLGRGERMGEREIRAFLESMLDVLEYLHGLSPPVIHRDIKPSNIMRRYDGTYALIDFDTVQRLVMSEVGGSTVVGTSGYMAPEQLVGRAVPASDLYGLAATAVHLATGVHPMDLPMVRMQLSFREFSRLSEGLNRVLERMLEPDVAARLGSVGEVRAALLERGGARTKVVSEVMPEVMPVRDVPDVGALSTNRALPGVVASRPVDVERIGNQQSLWVRMQAKGDALVIVVLPRTVNQLEIMWGLIVLMNVAGLGCFVGFGGEQAVLGWNVLGIAAVGVLVSWFAMSAFMGNFLETGIEQRLTVSREGLRLEEVPRVRMSWRTKRRKPVSWFVAAHHLERVFVRFLSDAELRAASKELGRALHRGELEPEGLVVVDRAGNEYLFGQMLGMGDEYSTAQRRDLEMILAGIQAYLR